MSSHSSKPVGWNQTGVVIIERPFVERDLNGTASDKDANDHKQAEAPDLPDRQT